MQIPPYLKGRQKTKQGQQTCEWANNMALTVTTESMGGCQQEGNNLVVKVVTF